MLSRWSTGRRAGIPTPRCRPVLFTFAEPGQASVAPLAALAAGATRCGSAYTTSPSGPGRSAPGCRPRGALRAGRPVRTAGTATRRGQAPPAAHQCPFRPAARVFLCTAIGPGPPRSGPRRAVYVHGYALRRAYSPVPKYHPPAGNAVQRASRSITGHHERRMHRISAPGRRRTAPGARGGATGTTGAAPARPAHAGA